MKKRRFTDHRRKHQHWEAVVVYQDGKRFARTYIDKERAQAFAIRQLRSPVVRSADVTEVDK